MTAASQFSCGSRLAIEVLNMAAPTITGAVSGQTTTSETPIDPFSGVAIGDANAGATDMLSITLSGTGSLSGTGLSGSDGSYTLTGTTAAITSELRALSFTSVNGVPNTSVTTTFTLSDTSSAYGVGTYGPPLTLASFSGANGANPTGDLISDAAGDLFGTAALDGADGDGTVFEIAKSTGLLTTLATFTGANGEDPERSLTVDAAGDLFGTTSCGGAHNDGAGFETVKSTGALITLAAFTGAIGASALSDLGSDVAGDLFGTTEVGGADNDGTAFEIVKSAGALITLTTFTGANGEELDGGLTINSAGDLFGTTYYGGANDGTVFELPVAFIATPTVDNTTTVTVTDSDSVAAPTITGTVSSQTTTSETPIDPFLGVTIGDTNAGATDTLSITLSGPGSLSGTGLNGSHGSYTLTGTAAEITTDLDALTFTPATGAPGSVITTLISLSDFSSGFATPTTDGATTVTDTDAAVGPIDPPVLTTISGIPTNTASDFTGDGTSDVSLQNGGTVVDWLMKNGAYQSGHVLSSAAAGWTAVGTGDFTGNGTSDVLLQNGGSVVDWIMNNGVYQSGNVLTTAAAGWTAVGTGDFTGTGTDDVLLQNGGTVVDWIMKDGAYQSGNVLSTAAAGWTAVGTGDFTGKGTDDVLLQNGGTVVDWIMKDGAYQSGNVISTNAAGFNVVGTGDYNGDGTSDVLLQNGGTIADWIIKDGQYASGNILTTVATGWNVARS